METLFDSITFLKPWQKITLQAREAYELELKTELCISHPLYEIQTTAIARVCNGDDILFQLHGHPFPIAVVHLTFTGKEERNPRWPTFKYYENVQAWVERCMNPEAMEFQTRYLRRSA